MHCLGHQPHIKNIVTKASNFVKRNLSKCSSQVMESAYLSNNGQTTQLEYASDVWDPHAPLTICMLHGDIMELEKVAS